MICSWRMILAPNECKLLSMDEYFSLELRICNSETQIEWLGIINMEYLFGYSVTQSISLSMKGFSCIHLHLGFCCYESYETEAGGGILAGLHSKIYNSLFVYHYIVWSSIVISYYYIKCMVNSPWISFNSPSVPLRTPVNGTKRKTIMK